MSGHNKKDDPEKMEQMHRWLEAVRSELQLTDNPLEPVESDLLSLIGTVAHGPSRPGAPLTAFLAGYVCGKGADAQKIITQLQELAKNQQD
ncbi:DUF6457 domain-containing protein [Varibaculum vaginae]|uniref:DUF6457 domain-containing protein n=1 Tax=Varibaculum vaginae TaxID=2364797 RepID=UPI000F0792F3|nr:DUF6457 domain-containing protein [Varibaculum vaginae]